MSDCIQCKCEPITPSNDACLSLQKANDEKIREFAIMYRDLQTCNLASEGAKGFYNIWCVLKSVIGQICFLMGNIKEPKEYKAGTNIEFTQDGDNIVINAKGTDLSDYLTKDDASKTYQKILKAGNNITLNNDGTISAVVPEPKEVDLTGYLTENKANSLYQIKLKAGSNITLNDDGTISANIPAPKDVDLSGYVTKEEYNLVKDKLDKIIQNLKDSGAWSGDDFVNGRNIATGNINVFGRVPDGNSFIRTNNGQTENDIVVGVE